LKLYHFVQKSVGKYTFLFSALFLVSISGYFVITQRLIEVRLLSDLARKRTGFLPTALVTQVAAAMSLCSAAVFFPAAC
jgi:hypothetical protein